MEQKSVSPAVAMTVILIIFFIFFIVLLFVGWAIFFKPRPTTAEKVQAAKTAEAPTASEAKPQAGMVVDWEPEQSLPDSVNVQIVLDRDNSKETGTFGSWLAHAVFAYRGEKAKVEIDSSHGYTILTWALWSEPGDEPNDQGSVFIETRENFMAPTGQEVLIYEITRVETVRLK